MDAPQGGTLANWVSAAPGGRLTEQQARWFFQQTIIALDFCHRRVGHAIAS